MAEEEELEAGLVALPIGVANALTATIITWVYPYAGTPATRPQVHL